MHTMVRNSGVPECVPLEPKTNFERFLACMARTDKSLRGSSQIQSSQHAASGNSCLNIRNVMSVMFVMKFVHVCMPLFMPALE